MTDSFCSYRPKIHIQEDLLLSDSVHTWLPDSGVSRSAAVGLGPVMGRFHFLISRQICGLTLHDVQHNTLAICHSPGSRQLQQLAEK